MKLNKHERKSTEKEIERIYFRKIWRKLIAEWIKISDKIKNN